jgi:hypothetical protein
MDPLIATVISIVSPYLVKGAEEFAKSAGKAAFDGTKALVDRLSQWWNNDPIANAAATSIESDPEHYGKMLGAQLEHQLKKDASFANELRVLVDDLGPSVDVIQRMEVARGVTGADIGTLTTGRVRVEQTIGDAQDVTGFKANKVGGSD